MKDTLHDSQGAATPGYELTMRLQPDTHDWLVDDVPGEDVLDAAVSIVEVEHVRRDNIQDWRFLLNWAEKGSWNRVRVLQMLVEHRHGVTYDMITNRVPVGKRRVQDFVGELRDAGIVETPGRPAQVRFTDDDYRVLAADITNWL